MLCALTHIERDALAAILTGWLTNRWERERERNKELYQEKYTILFSAKLTRTIRWLHRICLLVKPNATYTFEICYGTAIGILKTAHALSIANANNTRTDCSAYFKFRLTVYYSLISTLNPRIFRYRRLTVTKGFLILTPRTIEIIGALAYASFDANTVILTRRCASS